MPGHQDSVAMPVSPPPPQDLPSYSRFMLDHTKRQMEASGATGYSPTHKASSLQSRGSSMTNGTSPNDYCT